MLTLRCLSKRKSNSRGLRVSLSQLRMSSQALVKLPRAKREAKGLLPTGLVLGRSKQGLLQVRPTLVPTALGTVPLFFKCVSISH